MISLISASSSFPSLILHSPRRQFPGNFTGPAELPAIEPFGRRVGVLLPTAEGYRGNPAGTDPIGIQAAVGDRPDRIAAQRADRLFGRKDRGAVVGQAERLVVQAAVDFHGAALAVDVLDAPRGLREGPFDGLDDLLAESRVVAAGFGADVNFRSDDVRGLAALDYADVRRAAARRLFDLAQPALAVQVGDCQRGDGDCADAPFGRTRRRGWPCRRCEWPCDSRRWPRS